MRIVYVLVIVTLFSGCAVKPTTVEQTYDGLRVGLNKNTDDVYRLVDNRKNVVSNTKSTNKILTFSFYSHTLPSTCYTVIDEDGNKLFENNKGFRITSVNDYYLTVEQKKSYQSQYDQTLANHNHYDSAYDRAKKTMEAHRLFNGRTCDLPPMGKIPPKPISICGGYSQCQKLVSDSCLADLAAAETCAAALSKADLHSSFPSVGCGAVVSIAKTGSYGLGAAALDAITGMVDENAKQQFNSGNYTESFFSAVFSVGIRYFRLKDCKEDLLEAAYSPIRRWESQKSYIQDKPYRLQNACVTLIKTHNSTLNSLENLAALKTGLATKIQALSDQIREKRKTSSEPVSCKM